jgi:aspartyl-tRNA(Asn)/glutamyl-tRNA(Gln) amidotransferase subunit A
LSLPVGSDKDGMPIGLQLIGNIYEDQTVFDGAFGLEKALKDT